MSAPFFPVVIHHNPDCGTSRNALDLICVAGYEPTLIAYLDTGWTRPQLQALFAVQRSASILANRVVDRGLAMPPTIRVQAGARISVVVTRQSAF